MRRSSHSSVLPALLLALVCTLLSACQGSDAGSPPDNDGDVEQTADGDTESEAVEYPWDDASLTVMTFNVMCSFCHNDQGNDEPWADRIPHFGDIITRHKPDLIGLQELTYAKEVPPILAVAPGYTAVYAKGLPKNDLGWTAYPDATILYRSERFTLVESGHYWNSPTPDTEWAGGFNTSAFWRIVVWARLKQVSDGREFYFVNTHFDNNTPNQANSAPLALSRLEPWAAATPVIFVGDFNSKPDSEAYGILKNGVDGQGFKLKNIRDLAPEVHIATNQTPDPAYDPANLIDHIWLAGPPSWTGSDWTVDMTTYGPNSVYPSDHFPIITKLGW